MCVDMSKMSGGVSPSDVQATGDPVVSGSDINWGNPDNDADFFRADKAMMGKMNIKKADVKPTKTMAIKPKKKSKSKNESKPKRALEDYDYPDLEYKEETGNAFMTGPDGIPVYSDKDSIYEY